MENLLKLLGIQTAFYRYNCEYLERITLNITDITYVEYNLEESSHCYTYLTLFITYS